MHAASPQLALNIGVLHVVNVTTATPNNNDDDEAKPLSAEETSASFKLSSASLDDSTDSNTMHAVALPAQPSDVTQDHHDNEHVSEEAPSTDTKIAAINPQASEQPDPEGLSKSKSSTSFYSNYIAPVVEVANDVGSHWWNTGLPSIAPVFMRQSVLERSLLDATTFAEFQAIGAQLDHVCGHDIWKRRFECPLYDYDLVRDVLDELYVARRNNDYKRCLYLLRASLRRNLGGMGSEKLYHISYTGTKDLIEHYIDEVVYQLHTLSTTDIPGLSQADKTQMLVHMRHSYGRSALLLSGGGGLGIYHVGIVQALYEANLLPRIISGSSAGALVGAAFCVSTPEEIEEFFRTKSFKSHYMLSAKGEDPTLLDRLMHLINKGTLCDINILKQCCRENIGDITFQEAYDRTHRILNVSINSSDEHEVPRLLNYLTAPNVVIWSAVCASCALSLLFDPVEIIAKDCRGRLVSWSPEGQLWSDGSIQSDMPSQRIAELFNVNHFIVSQVNPHVVPLMTRNTKIARFLGVIGSELHHRCGQLADLGLLPKNLEDFSNIISQSYYGDVTIVPCLEMEDYKKVLSNPLPENVERAMKVGRQAVWRKMAMVSNHCKIEIALDDIVRTLQGVERWTIN